MKKLFVGFILGFALASCSTLAFNYKHYVLNLETGMLQATDPADDLPLSICNKGADGYHCDVMMIEEFHRLKTDKLKCDIDLDSCQRNCTGQ